MGQADRRVALGAADGRRVQPGTVNKPASTSLKTADVIGLYAIGFRRQVWQHVPNHPGVRSAMTKDKQYLLQSVYQNVKAST